MATTGTGSHDDGQFDFVGFDLSYNEVNQTVGFNRRHEGNTGNFYVYQENSTHRLSKSYAGVNQPHLLGTTAPSTDSDEYTSRLDYSLDDASDRLNKSTYIPNPASTGDLFVDYDENTFTNSPSGQEGDGRMHQPKILNDGALHEKDYRYDSNGNLLADKQFLYVYDAFNRLAQIWKDADQDFTLDDPGDVCLMEFWYDCRGLCCAVGYGPGFTGTGPNGIHGYSNYYGAGTVPIENGELELDGGDVIEKLDGTDPIVSLQTFVPGLGAGTIQPVGGTDKFLPLLGPDGCVYALADPSDGKIKERVRFGDFGRPVFNGIKASGIWELVDPDGGGAGEPVSYSGGTTTIFAFAGEYSATYGTWDGLSLQPSVFGSPTEFAITDISYNYTADAWEIDVAGDATALVIEDGYFEVIDSPTFAVTNVTFDNNSTPTNSVDDITVITVSTSPGATDSLIGRLLIPNLSQPDITFEIVDNLDSGGTYTLTVAGDATDLVSSGNLIRLPTDSSPSGNIKIFATGESWHGGTVNVGGNAHNGPIIALDLRGRICSPGDMQAIPVDRMTAPVGPPPPNVKPIPPTVIDWDKIRSKSQIARESEDYFGYRHRLQQKRAEAEYQKWVMEQFAAWAVEVETVADELYVLARDAQAGFYNNNWEEFTKRYNHWREKGLSLGLTEKQLSDMETPPTELVRFQLAQGTREAERQIAWINIQAQIVIMAGSLVTFGTFGAVCGTTGVMQLAVLGAIDGAFSGALEAGMEGSSVPVWQGALIGGAGGALIGGGIGAFAKWLKGRKAPEINVKSKGGKGDTGCFPAGTLVWVLKRGVAAAVAVAAIAAGAPAETFATTIPIEEVRPGDYVLSQPEDDPHGPLSFQEVTDVYANPNHQVEWLALVDEETGEREWLPASSHPLWVEQAAGDAKTLPIANVWKPHLREVRHYAEELAQVTDRYIRSADVRRGYVLVGPDGQRVTLSEQIADDLKARGYADPAQGWRWISALLSARGWAFSTDLTTGDTLRGANGRRLRIERIEWKRGPVAVYNLRTAHTATFFVGRLQAWAHNENGNSDIVDFGDDVSIPAQPVRNPTPAELDALELASRNQPFDITIIPTYSSQPGR